MRISNNNLVVRKNTSKHFSTTIIMSKFKLVNLISTTAIAIFLTTNSNNKAEAYSLSWRDEIAASEIDWTPLDGNTASHTFASGQTFNNIDGSGIDVKVIFSDNMYDASPNIYNTTRPLDDTSDANGGETYNYAFRFTNETNLPRDPTWVAIEFSQPVTLDEFWLGSISKIGSRNEVMRLSAYSGTYSTDNSGTQELDTSNLDSNDLVAASKYDTYQNFFGGTTGSVTGGDLINESTSYSADNPSSVNLDTDGNEIYETVGLGAQLSGGIGEYGRVFFEYDTPVQTIFVEHEAWNNNNPNDPSNQKTSVVLSPEFQFQEVPFEFSPTLGLLLSGGILGSQYLKHKYANKIRN